MFSKVFKKGVCTFQREAPLKSFENMFFLFFLFFFVFSMFWGSPFKQCRLIPVKSFENMFFLFLLFFFVFSMFWGSPFKQCRLIPVKSFENMVFVFSVSFDSKNLHFKKKTNHFFKTLCILLRKSIVCIRELYF